ncbi:MAG: thioredoxin family protein [Bacteroidales bacterium]|nr:thioredoxin family protein [Bacteroidales bacterium]
MKKILLFFGLFTYLFSALYAQGYEINSKANDFKLLNVNGKYFSLAENKEAKGFVVIFTCNHCPYAQAYEQRIIEFHNKYAKKGYPVVAINPNDSVIQPADSYSKMIERSKDKNYPFVYLLDDNHKVQEAYGAQRTPHVFVLQKNKKDLIVKYIGTIDDSSMKPGEVKERYLEDAVNALLDRKEPNPSFTKAIGCSIKKK